MVSRCAASGFQIAGADLRMWYRQFSSETVSKGIETGQHTIANTSRPILGAGGSC